MAGIGLNIIICCNRCKTSFYSDTVILNKFKSKWIYNQAMLYSCPDCNHVDKTFEWTRA